MVNILLVEDDEDDKMLFSAAIEKLGKDIKCTFANNGFEALTMLTSLHDLPKVIFMDINMPLMNGIECLETIKSHQRLKDIPVIILSTSQNKREVGHIKDLGAAYLEKATSFEALKNAIADFLTSLKM